MAQNVVLVTGSYDHTLIFWDAQNGIPNQTIEYGEKVIINRLDTSNDKRFLACGGNFFTSYYDIPSMKSTPVHVFDGYKNNISGIGFFRDSNYLHTCSEDGWVRIHDLRMNSTILDYQEKEGLNCAALHPNENDIILGDNSGNIKVFDKEMGKIRMKFTPTADVAIRSICIDANATQLVAADSAGFIHQYRILNKEITEDAPYLRYEAHPDYILKVAISPDIKYMASCGADKMIKLWTLNEVTQKWDLKNELFGHGRWVWDCVFSCDSEYLISASSDKVGKIWSCENGDLLRTLKAHKMAVNCITLNDIAIE